jgi:hypothetical protein
VREVEAGAEAREATVPVAEGESVAVAATSFAGTGPERAEEIRPTAIEIAGPEVIREPDTAVAYRAELTPAGASADGLRWTVTEPDGSPTDLAAIDDRGVLTVNRRSGDVRITASSGDGVRATLPVTIAIDPALIRDNAARWLDVTATASSAFDIDFGAGLVRDGFGPFSGDWASDGEREPWVQLDWDRPVQADRVVLYDRRAGDDANGGTLTFSDGTSVDVTGIPRNGDPKAVKFPLRTFDWVRFQVRGGTGPNPGLLELEVMAVPR